MSEEVKGIEMSDNSGSDMVDRSVSNSTSTEGLSSFGSPYRRNDYAGDSAFDNHTVFVTNIGPTNAEQLSKAFREYFDKASKKLGIRGGAKYWGDWKINIVRNREEKPIGVAYVFFMKPEAYYVILDRNTDGSERTMEVDNPDYKESDDEMDFDTNMDFSSMSFSEMSWGDMCSAKVSKTINVKIEEPIADFPEIKLTKEQMKSYDGEYVQMNVRRCKAVVPDCTYDKYTLMCAKAPVWINKAKIEELFRPYVTCKRDLDNGYPKVTIVKGNNKISRNKNGWNDSSDNDWKKVSSKPTTCKIFVKFNSTSNDSMFALLMNKKITLEHKNNKTTMMFFHARASNC